MFHKMNVSLAPEDSQIQKDRICLMLQKPNFQANNHNHQTFLINLIILKKVVHHKTHLILNKKVAVIIKIRIIFLILHYDLRILNMDYIYRFFIHLHFLIRNLFYRMILPILPYKVHNLYSHLLHFKV